VVVVVVVARERESSRNSNSPQGLKPSTSPLGLETLTSLGVSPPVLNRVLKE
jgi:hypothetical protein